MPTPRVTALLNAERTRLQGMLNVPQSNYARALIKKTLACVERMRQQVGEGDADYAKRLSIERQTAVAGLWAGTFWADLDAARQTDLPPGG